MKRFSRKGFTIVELVIVIAVIAILAAVLIPTFSSVTQSAKVSAAQQQAKAGLDSILALTGGVLPDGTLFAISDDDDNAAEYWFAYTGNKLQQVDINAGTYPETYSGAEYAAYVSASCWVVAQGGNSADADKAAANLTIAKEMILDVFNKGKSTTDGTYKTIAVAPNKTSGYFEATLTPNAADGVSIKVRLYYTTDIQTTQVIFVGN